MDCKVNGEATWIVWIVGTEYLAPVMDRDSLGFDDSVEGLQVAVEEKWVQSTWRSRGLTQRGEGCSAGLG